MLHIKREVDIYHNKSLDYKRTSISKNIDDFLKEVQNNNPRAKLNKKDVNYYKFYVVSIVKNLPIDFWLQVNLESNNKYCITPSIDVGITIGLCGLFLFAVPNPYCQKVGITLMAWGVNTTVTGILQKLDEDEKKRLKIERQRRRDSSQCSKKSEDCEYCRKRYGL